ncbi:hypothetical protein [Nesterenkonia pannonica]|nr:hypothetical protein [Nesterenkonia pannonica]
MDAAAAGVDHPRLHPYGVSRGTGRVKCMFPTYEVTHCARVQEAAQA